MIDDDRGGMESDHGGRSNRPADESEEPAGERGNQAPDEAAGDQSGERERPSGQSAELREEPAEDQAEDQAADQPRERPEAVETRAEQPGADAGEAGPPPPWAPVWSPRTDGHEPAPGPDGRAAGRDHDGDTAAPGLVPPRPVGENAGWREERAGGSGAGSPGGPDTGAGRLSGTAPGPAQAGIAGLSAPYRVVAGLVMAVLGLFTCVHLAMVFLHVAPSNTLSKQYGQGIYNWIYPEFEQNWKLFAPNPLQQNISVHVRAEVVDANGDRRTTPWMSLSGEDGKAILHNPLPSHAHQNELRRAWDFYVNTHDDKNRSTGTRGKLAEAYLRRIVMLRLGEHDYGGTVDRVQLRSSARMVPAPAWSTEKTSTRPMYRELAWWTVSAGDLPEGSVPQEAVSGEEADQ